MFFPPPSTLQESSTFLFSVPVESFVSAESDQSVQRKSYSGFPHLNKHEIQGLLRPKELRFKDPTQLNVRRA